MNDDNNNKTSQWYQITVEEILKDAGSELLVTKLLLLSSDNNWNNNKESITEHNPLTLTLAPESLSLSFPPPNDLSSPSNFYRKDDNSSVFSSVFSLVSNESYDRKEDPEKENKEWSRKASSNDRNDTKCFVARPSLNRNTRNGSKKIWNATKTRHRALLKNHIHWYDHHHQQQQQQQQQLGLLHKNNLNSGSGGTDVEGRRRRRSTQSIGGSRYNASGWYCNTTAIDKQRRQLTPATTTSTKRGERRKILTTK